MRRYGAGVEMATPEWMAHGLDHFAHAVRDRDAAADLVSGGDRFSMPFGL